MKSCQGEKPCKYSTDISSGDEGIQLNSRDSHETWKDIVPRPNTSPGYWLCCLLPIALVVGYCNSLKNQTQCPDIPLHFKIVTVISAALCIQTISFFIYPNLQAKLHRWLIVSIPFVCGTWMYKVLLNVTWSWSLLCITSVVLLYQRCYIRFMRALPLTFTYGEASILSQGILLFVVNTLLVFNSTVWKTTSQFGDFANLNIIMTFALFWLLIVCILLAILKCLRKPLLFYLLILIFTAITTLSPITKPLPIIFLFDFILRDAKRIYIISYFLILVGATVFVINRQMRNSKQASTRLRKIFHFLVVLVYVPGLLYECVLLYIASGVALAVMTIFDVLRILRMPPFGNMLENAFHSFADEKDSGVLSFTPFCLLIGCSMPMWLFPCACYKNSSDLNPGRLALFAGVLTIGFGDTAASIFGSKFGRTKWKNSARSYEGSIAYIVAVLIPVFMLSTFEFLIMTPSKAFIVVLATFITCLIEAHTDQVDNLVLPFVFYIIIVLA